MDPVWYWTILIVANSPIYLLTAWLIFDNWNGFVEAVHYCRQPDSWSWLRGEGLEDFFSEMKMLFWIVSCASLVALEHFLLKAYVL